MDETAKFLEGLESDQDGIADILEQPFTPQAEDDTDTTKVEDEGGEEGYRPKNRRERRLFEKLQAERESASFLAGKLAAREEVKGVLADEESDYLKAVERIYGTDTPEAQLATELLKKAIVGARDDAERRAYERVVGERERETEAVAEAENELDSYIDEIEDSYNVELNPAQEQAYFELMHKMSPKDREGNVVAYADPHAVWDVFQERLQRRGNSSRAKELSARSMTESGASKDSSLKDDTVLRELQENGII